MSLSKEAEQVLAETVSGWFSSFEGISAIDVARALSMDHAAVMCIYEDLANSQYGSLNRSVELGLASLDLDNISAGLKFDTITTHMFFPSKAVLNKAFFDSDLPKKDLPEYKKCLFLGAGQAELIFFSEEVLARYFCHPEFYEINDSLAGGDVSALSSASDDRHLYVRYGKCQLMLGQIVVTAIAHDLSEMGQTEQRHWHSNEIEKPDLDKTDPHFDNFLRRTYDGEIVDYHDPIAQIFEAIRLVNEVLVPASLFSRLGNIHLRLPVEQTYKSYCDASSELYKVLGPDAISAATLKDLLQRHFGIQPDEFIHAETKRALSQIQLFSLLEKCLEVPGLYTKPLKDLSGLRTNADHKILDRSIEAKPYSREFAAMCDQFSGVLSTLADLLAKQVR